VSASPARRSGAGRPRPAETPKVDGQQPGLAARKVAARLLAAIIDARTSLDGLTDNDHGHPQYLALDMRDRALVRAILSTALRFHVTIGALISARLDRPLPDNARSLSHILHVGAAQMLFLDVPDSAAVDLAVSHARSDPRTARFASLVNAVLREIGRRKERALPAALAQNIDAPDWLFERLEATYGHENTHAILAMHRHEAPTDFTVKSDPELWAGRLGGIVLPTGTVRVAKLDGPITALPGFADGEWWVQDVAASLPARLFGDMRSLRVLDLCAAPGGKTAQLAHIGARVTALDLSRNRLKRLAANLERLKLEAELVEGDALAFEAPQPFDAVLLDAPCSSTGTARRHPDIPWTKTPDDVTKLAGLQHRLLEHACTLVKPGGRVVFSNCSLDPEEGEQMLAAFLAGHRSVKLDPIGASELPGLETAITPEGALRTTPADLQSPDPALSGMDGFFAARLIVGAIPHR